jgi:aminopeptidase
MPFPDFISCFRSACAQPWKEIHAAQEVLIKRLNQGSQLIFRANQDDPNPTFRTEVSMSIEGMTFCNSTIARNFPGSEVFSAPLRASVKGQIFAPGRYVYEQAPMTDMLFRIKDGEIVFAEAREGNDELQRILSNGTQRAARFFGETALGTNPGIGRRMVHPLLAEKTAGTFHMAIGHCYEHTNYEGTPVTVNNGNTSDLTPVHWDITIPMYPAAGGGEVILDGDVIQRDGEFLDNRLSLLSYRKN